MNYVDRTPSQKIKTQNLGTFVVMELIRLQDNLRVRLVDMMWLLTEKQNGYGYREDTHLHQKLIRCAVRLSPPAGVSCGSWSSWAVWEGHPMSLGFRGSLPWVFHLCNERSDDLSGKSGFQDLSHLVLKFMAVLVVVFCYSLKAPLAVGGMPSPSPVPAWLPQSCRCSWL